MGFRSLRGQGSWCVSVLHKLLLTFDCMYQLGCNFQGLVGWLEVTFAWVVSLPSPYHVGLGLLPGLSLKSSTLVDGATVSCNTILESI